MRIPDILLSNNYLNRLTGTKSRMEQLNRQIATGVRIEKPSDSPSGSSKIMRFINKLNQSDVYSKNIQNGLAFLNESTFAMENIQSEILQVLTRITEINNPTNENLDSFADQIDSSLTAILNAANSQYDGKYLFGGTDFSMVPYGFTGDNSSILVKVNDVSGEQKIKISHNILQKINLTGTEVFGTILTQTGNVDVNSLTGDSFSNQLNIKDAEGNDFTFNATYIKTGANTYSLTYDIVDSGGTSVYGTPPAAKTLTFDPASGKLRAVDGNNTTSINIQDPSGKINFTLDFDSFKETNSASSLSLSANQQSDIFNILIQIRDNLRAGIKPSEEQEDIIKDFNKRILDKITQTGNVINQLIDTEELLSNQRLSIEELLSKEQEVDVPKAIMELQNLDYTLQITYKLSAMFLPKSILDYL